MLSAVFRDPLWERDGPLLLIDPLSPKVGDLAASLPGEGEELNNMTMGIRTVFAHKPRPGV
jgi:hypothetical protein